MDYKAYFAPWAAQTNKFLAQHFKQRASVAKKANPLGKDAYNKIEEFITGGKRIRGGLVKLGYESAKGKNSQKILPASAAIEITHGAILIHDDIIDQANLRHGRSTVHKKYESYHSQNYKKGSANHYGISMAICVGDLGFYDAILLISHSKFAKAIRLEAINHLSEIMINTCIGELLDVDLSYQYKISEKEITTINRLKTAYYTIVGPLSLGGILANANTKLLNSFEAYGIPLGIAFQLQDDILGMFGSEKKLGKPIDSDIKEGKNTILYTQALKKSSPKQQKHLKALWGSKNLTTEDIKEAQGVIKSSGSLAYCQKLATKLAEKAKDTVPSITKDKNLQEVYTTLADFIIDRES